MEWTDVSQDEANGRFL